MAIMIVIITYAKLRHYEHVGRLKAERCDT